MVEHFSFESSKKETLKNIRTILEGNGFIIKEYAPEDAFLFTEFKLFEWNTGRRLLAVTIHINDKITMTGMGKMDIPVSDLGKPEDLMKLKSFDKLPYSVQKKTFIPLIELFNKNGYKSLKHWP